jgi:hypothetical protein
VVRRLIITVPRNFVRRIVYEATITNMAKMQILEVMSNLKFIEGSGKVVSVLNEASRLEDVLGS